MSHVMIDLETMGVGHDPAILSVGACVFDPLGGDLGPGVFYQNIDLLSCVMAGLKIEPDTVTWWREQGPEAQRALEANKQDLSGTLVELSNWLDRVGAEFIWTNGPMSDHVWLESAYRACGLKGLMAKKNGYRTPRDYRTIVEAAEAVAGFDRTTIPAPSVAHSALDDARAQAVGVQMAYDALRSRAAGSTDIITKLGGDDYMTDVAETATVATDLIHSRTDKIKGAFADMSDELERILAQPLTIRAVDDEKARLAKLHTAYTEEAGRKAELPVYANTGFDAQKARDSIS